MPELPEVETVKRSLAPDLIGKKILSVDVYLEKAIKPSSGRLKQSIPGRSILELSRRGKYLILTLDNQKKIAFHLRMTGRLLYLSQKTPLEKHTVLKFRLDDGYDLRMVDQRKFGTVNLYTEEDRSSIPNGLLNLGPEPLLDEMPTGRARHVKEEALFSLEKAARRRKGPVKGLLLDQRVIAGLGNIYTDEALFRAGINPGRPANSLTEEEWLSLYQAICKVLKEGIKHRGTTRRDYVDGRGQPGGYQEFLQVYGRKGKICPNCGETLKYSRVAGRGTHYCSKCQL